ncbi:MAG TPA: formate--tetrahydrofolate ligase [Saprospiraceae bacterium]|nr:formate--tetrahydrofolate ligase [Saprospiraceae bacterium]
MATDISIAQESKLHHIREISAKLGIKEEDLHLYGNYKAKIPLDYIDEKKWKQNNLVLVSAISPTPAGEGKTTTSIGLNDGLNRIGKRSTVVLREPSLGPVFGIKGGATGGGYSQVLPMEDINLHFTGDFSAVQAAHNLLGALIDNNIQNTNNNLNIDPRTVTWKRVMDMNDRSLRHVIIGLGGTSSGIPRETGFDITSASEVMAILCLAENFKDLKDRLGNIFVGFTFDKKPVFARDLKAHGAMAALLKDTVKPNLVQTIEGNPALIHGGPFANIAQGTNSVLATKMGLSLSDYVVTEAGFGFDLGAEKFFDIKCVSAGLKPKAVVLVATVRALKYHGGVKVADLKEENVDAVKAGLENLEKHLENIKKFNMEPVVAINHFISDTDAEVAAIQERCNELGVKAVVSKVWAEGGAGAEALARAVVDVVDSNEKDFKPMYDWDSPVKKKIASVAKKIYGASAVDYTSTAKKDLRKIRNLGLDKLPICIAKTQKSLSDNPKLLGRPKDFVVTVRQIEIAAGAGFLVPITGDILRMPGLPSIPSAEHIDISDDGVISGLF